MPGFDSGKRSFVHIDRRAGVGRFKTPSVLGACDGLRTGSDDLAGCQMSDSPARRKARRARLQKEIEGVEHGHLDKQIDLYPKLARGFRKYQPRQAMASSFSVPELQRGRENFSEPPARH